MSEKCQIDKDCTECVAYQCPCKPIPILLCKKHLETHLITLSNNGHNIKPLILQIPEESRNIILNEILKLKVFVHNKKAEYSQKTKLLLEKILSKYQKNIKKIQEIEKQLNQIWNMISHTNEIRVSKNNPEIIKIFLYRPETLPKKVCDLNLVKIEILSKKNSPSLKITENISKNFNIIRSDSELLVERSQGLCKNKHNLLLSSDTAFFYSFLNNTISQTRCDYCEKVIIGPNYHCRICSFDVCISCSKQKNFKPIKPLECEAKHSLVWIKSILGSGINSVTCDLCEADYSSSGWRCKECDFDICNKCSENLGIQIPFLYPLLCLRSHNLLCCESEKNECCSYCKNFIDSIHWKCRICSFSLCCFCSARAGYKVPVCKANHYLVSYTPKAKKFWRISTKSFLSKVCCKCQKKIEEESWRCFHCKIFICMGCFILSPILYLSYQQDTGHN